MKIITKIAFAVWNDRIAPVFDTTKEISIIDVKSDEMVAESNIELLEEFPIQKALRLAELGVNVLVCGAISKTLHDMITAYGIKVISFVAGNLSEVKKASVGKNPDFSDFAMPGCCGRKRLRRRGRCRI